MIRTNPFYILAAVLLTVGVGTIALATDATSRQLSTEPDRLTLCDTLVSSLAVGYANIDALAWASHQVVIGRVTEVLPPQWSEPLATGFDEGTGDDSLRTITTDYVVQVEDRIRGVDLDSVRVRLEGGTIGTCEIVNETAPSFDVGERVLLFLHAELQGDPAATFAITGVSQGRWVFIDEDHVVPATVQSADHEHEIPTEAIQSVSVMSTHLRAILGAGLVPEGDLRPERVVPLDVAPVVSAAP